MNWKFYVPGLAMASEMSYGMYKHDLGFTLIGGMFLGFWLMISAHQLLSLASDLLESDIDAV